MATDTPTAFLTGWLAGRLPDIFDHGDNFTPFRHSSFFFTKEAWTDSSLVVGAAEAVYAFK